MANKNYVGTNPETYLMLKKPEVIEKLVELRDRGGYSTWDQVKTAFNNEFNAEVSITALKTAYNRAMATSITVSGPKTNALEGLLDGLAQRLENSIKITNILNKELQKSVDWLANCEELDPIQRMNLIANVTKTQESLSKTNIQQSELILSQIQQVSVEQKKMQWDEAKVHEELNKLLPTILKTLEEPDENGNQKIVVVDRSILNE